jgi:2-amino-4-hydroxy-6-hydroxymethyldihydropteridine diphosphokinase
LTATRVIAYVGLGANLGDPAATVRAAFEQLGQLPGCFGARLSPVYRSAPVEAAGPDYANAVASLETTLTPEALLQALQAVELAFGRQRLYHHAPRTLDLDLLLQGTEVRATPLLTLPHPRLHRRAFVLRPLLDLVPGLTVAGLGPLAGYLSAVVDPPLVAWV